MIAFLSGESGADTDAIAEALLMEDLFLPPPVLAELHAWPSLTLADAGIAMRAPLTPLTPGFWTRAGQSRRIVLQQGLKAKLADALIAQCCIDAGIALITRDRDYRHFERWCGLRLAIPPDTPA